MKVFNLIPFYAQLNFQTNPVSIVGARYILVKTGVLQKSAQIGHLLSQNSNEKLFFSPPKKLF